MQRQTGGQNRAARDEDYSDDEDVPWGPTDYFVHKWNTTVIQLYTQLGLCGFKKDYTSDLFVVEPSMPTIDDVIAKIESIKKGVGFLFIINHVQVHLVESDRGSRSKHQEDFVRWLLVRLGIMRGIFTALSHVWVCRVPERESLSRTLMPLCNRILDCLSNEVLKLVKEIKRIGPLVVGTVLNGVDVTEVYASHLDQVKARVERVSARVHNEGGVAHSRVASQASPFGNAVSSSVDIGHSKNDLWHAVADLAARVDITHAALERMHNNKA